jgi:hypothetical protein
MGSNLVQIEIAFAELFEPPDDAIGLGAMDADVGRAILIPREAGGLIGAIFADLPEAFGTGSLG